MMKEKEQVGTANSGRYVPPTIQVMCVELEEGFAAGSCKVYAGDENNPNIPKVEEWVDKGTFTGDNYDM